MYRAVLWGLSWVPVSLAFTQSVAQIAWVQGVSMQPSLNPDNSLGKRDLVLLKKYGMRKSSSFKNGDVVVVRSPLDPERVMIKRVIGVEGQVIHPRPTANYPHREVRIPPNHLWIEGDNIHSIDSNTFGPISIGLITGKAVKILLPFDRIGPIPKGGRETAVQ